MTETELVEAVSAIARVRFLNKQASERKGRGISSSEWYERQQLRDRLEELRVIWKETGPWPTTALSTRSTTG